MDLDASMFGSRYALLPDTLLTPSGVKSGWVIAVEDGRIAAVSDAATFTAEHPDWPVVKLPHRAITPGFVDAHTHVGQTFGKAAIAGEPMQIWRRIWIPLENHLDEERSFVAAVWMMLEAVRGGFTTLVNFTRNSYALNLAVHKAANLVGIRLVSGCAASTESGPLQSVIEDVEQHIECCEGYANVHPSICFGFYASTLKGFRSDDLAQLGALCQERDLLLQMHSNEHFVDVHDCIVSFGKRPIELWNELGVLGTTTLLHHVTLISEREIEILEETRTGVSYNPVASQWKGNAVAPALAFAARGSQSIRMGLGTDATRMDAFRNLDAAEACQRITAGMQRLDFSCGAGWTWVDAATRGAAAAAGIDDLTGSLTPGHAADFLILDMLRPEVIPSWDFEWELVRHYDRDQIDAVVVAGRPVMLNGKSVGWDAAAFIRDNADIARDTLLQAGITRVHGPSGPYRAGA